MKKIILGAPRHVHEAPTALLSRLRRSPVPADLPNSLDSLLDGLQGLHNKDNTLEDLLKEGEKFESRPNGGSFSPVRSKDDAYQISSLPE
jgi:PleD family two-component response regulator